ncbi:TniQ family protein [Streptomyces sp. NPDC058122]|uniref:TniQ family protein n=1 Tax=Streptomyces sp. NPDC058122 TaxID=3346349 RepID=UPI0036E0DDD5
MVELHGLARSLVPLPGESLPGLLLRLSYRLERTPHRIAVLCGLNKGYRIPGPHLLKLPEALANRTSHCLQLSSAETDSLILHSLAGTYLPLALTPISKRLTHPKMGANWTFNLSSRYCPDCLRGDSSLIQQTLGGPWKLRWHLPTTFACPDHHRLLQNKCPVCDKLVNGFTSNRGGLICSPGISGLHPAQCRNLLDSGIQPRPGSQKHIHPCGARVDQTSTATRFALPDEDTDRLLALQIRLDQSMEDGAFKTQEVGYLSDLILAVILIKLSWPLGSKLLPSDALRSSLDAHAAPISAMAKAQQASPNSAGRLAGPRNLPQEAAPCGALLLAAESLLGNRDAEQLHDRVQPLARVAHERTPVYLSGVMASMNNSPAMSRAAALRPHGFPEGPLRRPRAPHNSFQIENVPAFLPEPWFDLHFAEFMNNMPHVNPWTTRQLRRGAALRLAEMASGQPWYRCTSALGIPNKSARSTISLLERTLGPERLWPAFEGTVAEIAIKLSKAARTDYANRRRTLADWRLPQGDWMALCDLRLLRNLRAKEDPGPGTVFVWSEATSAEYLHSPMVRALEYGTGPRASMTRAAGRLYGDHRPKGDKQKLQQRLKLYAAQIARACDLGLTLQVDVATLVKRANENAGDINEDLEIASMSDG